MNREILSNDEMRALLMQLLSEPDPESTLEAELVSLGWRVLNADYLVTECDRCMKSKRGFCDLALHELNASQYKSACQREADARFLAEQVLRDTDNLTQFGEQRWHVGPYRRADDGRWISITVTAADERASVGSTSSDATPAPVTPYEQAVFHWSSISGQWESTVARRHPDGSCEVWLKASQSWAPFNADDPRYRWQVPTDTTDQPTAAQEESRPTAADESPRSPDSSAVVDLSPVEQVQAIAHQAGLLVSELLEDVRQVEEPERYASASEYLLAKVSEHRRRQSRLKAPSSVPRTWPSDVGHECERFLVYKRTQGEQAAPTNERAQGYFLSGRVHEEAARAELRAAGVVICDDEKSAQWDTGNTGGRIDGSIQVPGSRAVEDRVIFDLKRCNDRTFNAVRTWDDLTKQGPWMRKYQAQLVTYAAGLSEQLGRPCRRVMVLLVNVENFSYRPVEHTVTDDEIDAILAKLERVESHVQAGTLPDRVDVERGWCWDREGRRMCAFAESVCWPEKPKATPAKLVKDDQFAADVKRLLELKADKREHDQLDRRIKARLKSTEEWGPELIVVGAGARIVQGARGVQIKEA